MQITELVKTRSTCLRRQVGALIVRDRRIVSTGYNGAPSGVPHCDEVGCLRQQLGVPSGERHELCRAIHAEQNALIQAARYGSVVQGGTIYVTCQPCSLCAKMLINAGIVRIVYKGDYPDPLATEMLESAEVETVRFVETENG
jgi:dCMP deaminase